MKNKTKDKTKMVSFVVVNHNGKRYLPKCLDSIYAQAYPKNCIEIIFVDNNSGDKSVEFIKKKYPKAKIIKNKENSYTKANNLGVKKAKGELIFLLNNDAWLKENTLDILVKEISKNKKVGAVTGKIFFENGKLQSTGHVELPNLYFGDRGFMEKDSGKYNKKELVPSICFASVLIRKKCIDDIGLLDEDFVMYCEDVDFSIRARKKRWRLLYIPEAATYHKYKGTSYILNPEDPDRTEKYFVERNRLLLIAKHFPEKLPEALSTSASFYIRKEYGFIYDNLDLIIRKLIEEHPKKSFKILPDFFKELKKIIEFEKNLASVKSEINLKIKEKENKLLEKNRKIKQLQKEIKQLQKEIDYIKKESKKRENDFSETVERLKKEFQNREKELYDDLNKKENEKESLRSQLIEKIKKRDKIIHDFFSSKGYRYILEPLDNFYRLFVPKKKRKKTEK